MSVGRMGTGPPLSVSSDPRLFFSLLGTAIAGAFLGFAWITAAGVQTNYYSPGPALWSILLLFVAIGGVMLGAGVATGLGARYGNERDGIPWNPGTAGQGSPWWLGRAAVFTEITGIGLLLMGLGMPLANLGINHSGFPTVLSPTVLWVPEVVDGAALGTPLDGGRAPRSRQEPPSRRVPGMVAPLRTIRDSSRGRRPPSRGGPGCDSGPSIVRDPARPPSRAAPGPSRRSTFRTDS